MRITAKSGLSLLMVGVLLQLSAPRPVAAQTHTVVLDNFDVDPYTHFNPDSSDTIVYYPTTATPANWRWRYIGYGTPASGERNTSTVISGASWHFILPEAANLNDPNGSDDLTNAGPIIVTRFNRSNWEPRTFDEIIAGLSEPRIDWTRPVRFAVNVRANWELPQGFVGAFSEIAQGIFIFSYTGGVVQNVHDFVFQAGNNGDGWHEASIEVLGKDADDRFDFGVFGRVNFTATSNPLIDRSPALDFYFDNLRVTYTPLRSAPVVSGVGLIGLCFAFGLLGAWLITRRPGASPSP